MLVNIPYMDAMGIVSIVIKSDNPDMYVYYIIMIAYNTI